jgi:hypothetical protein
VECKKTRWKEYMEMYKNEGKSLYWTRNITSGNITIEEYRDAVKRLKLNKATGSDEVSGELIRNSNAKTQDEIFEIIKHIYQGKEIPEEWLDNTYVPLPKKRNTKHCEDYRTIALISQKLFQIGLPKILGNS